MANNLVIENANVRFRNFAGKESRYNPAGRRNFCLIIPDKDIADSLKKDGWNVKELEARDGYSDPLNYVQVAVSYTVNPPKIYLVNARKKTKTPLTEENVNVLDYADISNVDVVVSPYHWEVGSKSGIKGYLKTMYVTLFEDEFADKYEDINDHGELFPREEDDGDEPF